MAAHRLPIIFRYRILWHVLFWIACYVAYVLTYGGYWGEHYDEEALFNLILLPGRMFFTYLLLYVIIPHFLLEKRYQLFSIMLILHAIAMSFSLWMIMYFFLNIEGYTDYTQYPIIYPTKILNVLISNYAIPLSAASIKLFKWWYLDQQYKQELEKEKLSAELNYLKAQIHPHFLFNTLNNLYALTLKQSEKSSDMVLKLSGLLDYMLYQSNDSEVSLDKELEIVQGFLELEKMRYNERLKLNFEVEGNTGNKVIAPLLLLPFIENCFKHGASNDTRNPIIDIHILVNETKLEMKIVNSKPRVKNEITSGSNGIGLKNVKRRLELIYPDRHEMFIESDQNEFRVKLLIFWTQSNLN